MNATDVPKAKEIMDGLANIRTARLLIYPSNYSGATVKLSQPGTGPYGNSEKEVRLSRAATDAALRVRAIELDHQEADLRRRAAQIGLILDR